MGGRRRGMVAVIMGVAGAGKTTVGTELARGLGWRFVDADDFHPEENKIKMAGGDPLTDEDRLPWLENIHAFLQTLGRTDNCILACSALKKRYRSIIAAGCDVLFFCLTAKPEILQQRLERRIGHFFAPALLQSQLSTLEISDDIILVDSSDELEEIVRNILSHIHS